MVLKKPAHSFLFSSISVKGKFTPQELVVAR